MKMLVWRWWKCTEHQGSKDSKCNFFFFQPSKTFQNINPHFLVSFSHTMYNSYWNLSLQKVFHTKMCVCECLVWYSIHLHGCVPLFKNKVWEEQRTGARIIGLQSQMPALTSPVTSRGPVSLSNVHSTRHRNMPESPMYRGKNRCLKTDLFITKNKKSPPKTYL